jgi:hypothetical protein
VAPDARASECTDDDLGGWTAMQTHSITQRLDAATLVPAT